MKTGSQKTEITDQQKLKLFEEWKKMYSEALIKSLKPAGDVLQIGFDEIAAEQIQGFHPKSHAIIVSNPEAIKKALQWAKAHANCSVIEGNWKSVLSKLGNYKTIIFSEYMPSDVTSTINYLFSDEIMTEVEKTKELLKTMGEELANVPMRYSDNDLEEFYKKIGQYNQGQLASFFKNLAKNKNITEEQYEKIIKKHKLDSPGLKNQEVPLPPAEPMLECLEVCVKNHMAVGSRFCSFLNNVTSKYEDSQFFEKIITNPHLEYKENIIPLKVGGKNYDALVMTVEKK